jgi:hypothetical protein
MFYTTAAQSMNKNPVKFAVCKVVTVRKMEGKLYGRNKEGYERKKPK